MKKNYYKPFYKKNLRLRENIFNNKKILQLKKKKWQNFILFLKKKKKKIYDHSIFFKPIFGSFFLRKFKQTLLIKKKISLYYGGLLSKDFKKIFLKSSKIFKTKLNTKKNLLSLESTFLKYLENRLDIVIYRSYFSCSIRESRYFINSGLVRVNGIRITNNSFLLKKGDIISFDKNLFSIILSNLKKSIVYYSIPSFLIINFRILQISIVSEIEKTKFSEIFTFRFDLKSLIKRIAH